MPSFLHCLNSENVPLYDYLGLTDIKVLAVAIGSIEAAQFTYTVPMLVDGLHPVHLIIIRPCVFISSAYASGVV